MGDLCVDESDDTLGLEAKLNKPVN